jgi:hypothetical protein
MLRVAVLTIAVAASTGVTPAPAQTLDLLYKGTIRRAVSTTSDGWCGVEMGPSLLQRDTARRVQISIPALHYAVNTRRTKYYTLSGHALMIFDGKGRGEVKFDDPKPYPDRIQNPLFTDYASSARDAFLRIEFRINFPGNCSVWAVGTYRE